MSSNSLHSQSHEGLTNYKKLSNSLSESLALFNPLGSGPVTSETSQPEINYFCIYTLKTGGGEDIFNQICYYGTSETFQFELKNRDIVGSNARIDILNNDVFSPNNQIDQVLSEQSPENKSNDAQSKKSNSNSQRSANAPVRPRHGVPLDVQVRQVGLAQAMVNFSKTFPTPTGECDSVHSQKNRLIILQPEPDFFMLLSLKLSQRVRNSSFQKNKLVVDYLDYELDDAAVKAWLQRSYDLFALAHGPLTPLLDRLGRESLIATLEAFYDHYFYIHHHFDPLSLLKTVHAAELLHLSKANYLQCKNLFNSLTELNQHIQSGVIFFRGKLVPNDFLNSHSEVLIQFFCNLFKDDSATDNGEQYEVGSDRELVASRKNRSSIFSSFNPFKRYSTASPVQSPSLPFLSLWDSTPAPVEQEPSESRYFKPGYVTEFNPQSPLSLRLQRQFTGGSEPITKRFYLPAEDVWILACVYHFAPHSYIVLFYPEDREMYLTRSYFDDLERLLQPVLNDTLIQHLQKDYERYQQLKSSIAQSQVQFFNFNPLNQYNEIELNHQSQSMHYLVLDILNQLNRNSNQEILIRTSTTKRGATVWVGGRRYANGILVVIVRRDANVGDIEEEIRKLMTGYFNHLFLD